MSASDSGPGALARALRAHLEWDGVAGDFGLPAWSGPLPGARSVAECDRAGAGEARRPAPARAQEAGAVAAIAEPAAPPSMGSSDAAGDRQARLQVLEEQVRGCQRCELAQSRKQTVFARGNPAADLVFIGEGPGSDEDRLGSPFVGQAGRLLDKMIAAMGRGESDVYICNVVKCRPPNNRTPLPQEATACASYLEGQVDTVAPKVIVALGRCAAENLGCVPPSGGGWRGRWGSYRGIQVMPTYHPAFLLRSPEFKRPVWQDLQQVMRRLGKG